MLAFATSLILFAGGGGLYDRIFNIPGFELWKFINLGLFVAIMVYLTKKPLGDVRAEFQVIYQRKLSDLKKM